MEGYSKLANLMGDPRTDGHCLIFQKFESISAQNLLYLQAEIINLKETFDKIASIDSEDPDKRVFGVDWATLSSSPDSLQWQKWLEIRHKLTEYYKALTHHRMITGLPPPSKYDLDFLQRWLEHPDLGNSVFDGADSHVYNKPAGLGTLAWRGGEVDAMTGLLVTLLPNLYHWGVVHPFHRICGKWIKKPENHHDCPPLPARESTSAPEDDRKSCQDISTTSPPSSDNSSDNSSTLRPSTDGSLDESPPFDIEANIFFYRDTHFYRIATILGTLVSSLIPIAAIIVLSFVRNMTARLGIVCAFTAIFSVCLSLVTDAKRVENFAATAAFASVQVVFVGSTNAMMG